VQLPAGATGAAHACVTTKSAAAAPRVLRPSSTSGAVPVLASVSCRAAPIVPVACPPANAIALALRPATGMS
jgi:hypothetical protein